MCERYQALLLLIFCRCGENLGMRLVSVCVRNTSDCSTWKFNFWKAYKIIWTHIIAGLKFQPSHGLIPGEAVLQVWSSNEMWECHRMTTMSNCHVVQMHILVWSTGVFCRMAFVWALLLVFWERVGSVASVPFSATAIRSAFAFHSWFLHSSLTGISPGLLLSMNTIILFIAGQNTLCVTYKTHKFSFSWRFISRPSKLTLLILNRLHYNLP